MISESTSTSHANNITSESLISSSSSSSKKKKQIKHNKDLSWENLNSNSNLQNSLRNKRETITSSIFLSLISLFRFPTTIETKSTKSIVKLLLPSTYLKKFLPSKVYRLACYGVWLWWFVIGLLVLRKTERATLAVSYIKEHGHTVSLESLENSADFAQLIKQLENDNKNNKPPAILLLNQYALNMTFNYLCNTKIYPGAHERFVFVTLDSTTRDVLQKYWPNIRQFYWPTLSLHVRFLRLKFK